MKFLLSWTPMFARKKRIKIVKKIGKLKILKKKIEKQCCADIVDRELPTNFGLDPCVFRKPEFTDDGQTSPFADHYRSRVHMAGRTDACATTCRMNELV